MSSDAFMHACTHLKVHAEMGVGERFMQRWGWGKGSCRDGGGGKVHAEMGVGERFMQRWGWGKCACRFHVSITNTSENTGAESYNKAGFK